MGNYYIRAIINPRRLIDPDCDYLGILEPTEKSLNKLRKAFQKLFQETPIEEDIEQYYLYRVDQCVNMLCDKNKIYRELVRVMRKGFAPSRLERKIYQDNPTELLWEYMQQSGEDILRQLEKCYPKTYYYSYDVLAEMIDVSRYSDANKDEMLDLCGALRKLQSIDKAIKTLELDEKQVQKCLKRFEKLGASPIPLRKDFALNELPSITILLEQLGNNEDVLFQYQEKKYK